jgi:hypothetical protein
MGRCGFLLQQFITEYENKSCLEPHLVCVYGFCVSHVVLFNSHCIMKNNEPNALLNR